MVGDEGRAAAQEDFALAAALGAHSYPTLLLVKDGQAHLEGAMVALDRRETDCGRITREPGFVTQPSDCVGAPRHNVGHVHGQRQLLDA